MMKDDSLYIVVIVAVVAVVGLIIMATGSTSTVMVAEDLPSMAEEGDSTAIAGQATWAFVDEEYTLGNACPQIDVNFCDGPAYFTIEVAPDTDTCTPCVVMFCSEPDITHWSSESNVDAYNEALAYAESAADLSEFYAPSMTLDEIIMCEGYVAETEFIGAEFETESQEAPPQYETSEASEVFPDKLNDLPDDATELYESSGSFSGYEGTDDGSEAFDTFDFRDEEQEGIMELYEDSGITTIESLNIVDASFKSYVVEGYGIYVRTPCGEWSPTGVDVSAQEIVDNFGVSYQVVGALDLCFIE